jgi:hypothetical protein
MSKPLEIHNEALLWQLWERKNANPAYAQKVSEDWFCDLLGLDHQAIRVRYEEFLQRHRAHSAGDVCNQQAMVQRLTQLPGHVLAELAAQGIIDIQETSFVGDPPGSFRLHVLDIHDMVRAQAALVIHLHGSTRHTST